MSRDTKNKLSLRFEVTKSKLLYKKLAQLDKLVKEINELTLIINVKTQ